MKYVTTLLLTIITFWSLLSCAGQRSVSKENPESQTSVRMQLTDGSQREGIIVTAKDKKLIYVDAQSHEKETIALDKIQSITKTERVFDFDGEIIPPAEIESYKGNKNKLLYAGGGLVLGAAAGTALGIGLYAADQPMLGNVSILVFAGLGAWIFGKQGAAEDYEEAAFKARKARFQKDREEAVREEKQRLKKMEEEKQRLLEEIEKEKKRDEPK